MDTAQWPQEIVVKPLEEIVVTNTTCPKPAGVSGGVERKITRPQKEQALNCPRCNSTNTKFCYYNNYSLTQPRYFCKTCRRYWTEGGSLRNIPVGGGSRKNKRSSSSASSSISTTTSSSISSSRGANKLPDLITPPNPKILSEGQDLNLAFSQLVSQVPNMENESNKLSSLELLTGRLTNSNNFMPMQLMNPDPTSFTTHGLMIPMQDFKPTLSFSIDGIGSGFGSLQGVQETSATTNTTTNGRLLFPFEDLKQVSNTTTTTRSHENVDQIRDHGDNTTTNSSGYWTGMLGGGSW